MNLSDQVASQIMGELHELTKNIEAQQSRLVQVASAVLAASKEVSAGGSVLHSKNEKLLMQHVAEITAAMQQIKQMESGIQQAAKLHADAALSPLLKTLKDQTSGGLEYYVKARDIYRNISEKFIATTVIFGLLCTLTAGGAFYLGMKFEELTSKQADRVSLPVSASPSVGGKTKQRPEQ